MQLTIFDPDTALDLRGRIFRTTELGLFHQALPLTELAALLPHPKHPQGRKPWLSREGRIAVLFLKAYLGLSDQQLLERLHTDWALQYFCGLHLEPSQRIRDKDLIWRTRKWIGQHLPIKEAQQVLARHWKPWMRQTHLALVDATVYESYIKYPTEVKLLWDSIEWVHRQIKYLCKHLSLRRPRSKVKSQRRKQIAYQKRKRKTRAQKRRRCKALLYLLGKLIGQLDELILTKQEVIHQQGLVLDQRFRQRLGVVRKVHAQQQFHYDHPGESVKDAIVSLHKPFIRPIVRGKENKRVEFGAKVNLLQVDGINLIEHLSFDAFHEGNRLQESIYLHRHYFGKVRQVGADQIYATNANRSFCTAQGIATCFKPKGRPKQDATLRQQDQQMRRAIGKTRATVLEGSFGNEKNHYTLLKVKARTQPTEIAWIFFGIMSANAVRIAKRMPAANAPPTSKATPAA